MSNRISKLMICNNIKLDKEYKNVVNYTEQQMVTLCETNKVASSNSCSFIRNNGRIFTPFTYAQCLQSNYIAFQNPDYSNKWFFGWIDSVHYEGEKNTSIEYTVDVWSTWFSSLSFEQCMVEREHINSVDDVPGANIIPERVDTGDYVVNAHLRDKFNREAPALDDIVYYIVVASTKDMNTTNNVAGAIYNGIPTGIRYFYYGINKNPLEGESPVQDFIDALNRISASVIGGNGLDAIKSAFIAPYWLLKNGSSWVIPESVEPRQVFTSITPLSSLNGYTPKNKKLLTYPYCYMLVSNFQGESKILKQEFWKKLEHDVTTQDGYSTLLPAGDMVLQIWGALTEGCSIVAIPENYAGDEIASNMGVALGKFPQINWNSDSYTNWLTQNGVTGYTGALAQTAIGVATENPIFIGEGIGKGLTTMLSGAQASQLPPQNNGAISNGDIMLSMDENCFHILKMSITSQYAQKIDDYFTKYGYRVNALKIPNMTGRSIFNYIKIANDEDFAWGNLDAKSLEKINDIARNGVTIWHNHANIGNYSLQNT